MGTGVVVTSFHPHSGPMGSVLLFHVTGEQPET